MPQLSILAWNISEGTFDRQKDQMTTLRAIALRLKERAPDIIMLNEVCKWNSLTYNGVDQIKTIAQWAGYNHIHWTQTATLTLKGGKYVAVLSRIPLLSAKRIQHSSYPDGGGYATLHVTASINQRIHHIFSARFTAHDKPENASSHATLRDYIMTLPLHDFIIIGGDFNTGLERWDTNKKDTLNHVPQQYADFVSKTKLRHVLGGIGWAFPSPDDQLLIRGAYTINHAERLYPEQGMSDHPWVFAKLSYLEGLEGNLLSDGSLLREAAKAEVYVIFGCAKFWVPNPATLERLYGGWANVRNVPLNSLAQLPSVPCNGTILREENSSFVWLIENSKRRHITNPKVLERFGSWHAVRIVPDNAMASFAIGDQFV